MSSCLSESESNPSSFCMCFCSPGMTRLTWTRCWRTWRASRWTVSSGEPASSSPLAMASRNCRWVNLLELLLDRPQSTIMICFDKLHLFLAVSSVHSHFIRLCALLKMTRFPLRSWVRRLKSLRTLSSLVMSTPWTRSRSSCRYPSILNISGRRKTNKPDFSTLNSASFNTFDSVW